MLPLSVETCHWKEGEGEPLADTLKLAFRPAVTVWLEGSDVMPGATSGGFTVRIATLLVAEPAVLVATAR